MNDMSSVTFFSFTDSRDNDATSLDQATSQKIEFSANAHAQF